MVTDIKIIYNDKEYISIIKDILDNEKVQEMKKYRQHYNVNCFYHCLFVSYNTYLICMKHNFDYVSAARAGMLHDFFLYDWHDDKKKINRKGLHAFTHGKCAYQNANKIFKLNDKEKDIIQKHMWPITPSIPKYRETFIITYVDKIVTMNEKYIKISNKNVEMRGEV